ELSKLRDIQIYLYTFCTFCSSAAQKMQKGKYDNLPSIKMHLKQSAYSAVGAASSVGTFSSAGVISAGVSTGMVFFGRSSRPKDRRLVRLRFCCCASVFSDTLPSDSALAYVCASLPKIPKVARLKKLPSLRAARRLTVPFE